MLYGVRSTGRQMKYHTLYSVHCTPYSHNQSDRFLPPSGSGTLVRIKRYQVSDGYLYQYVRLSAAE